MFRVLAGLVEHARIQINKKMKEFLYQLLLLPGVLRRINSLGFGARFKRELRLTHLRTTFFRRNGSTEKTENIAGYKMRYCDFGSFTYLFRELFLNQEYSFGTKNTKPFILDCGSNIGMSVLYFKIRFPEAEIIAFEPDKDAFACLKENVSFNVLKNVTVNNTAVSKREGPVGFWRGTGKSGALGNTIYANPLKGMVPAESTRLSKYVDRKVDFLKLDVEGAELEVISDLAEAGKLEMVEQMFIEYHLHMPEVDDAFSKLLRILETSGFGYQLGGELARPFHGGQFQALHIFAYNKNSPSGRIS